MYFIKWERIKSVKNIQFSRLRACRKKFTSFYMREAREEIFLLGLCFLVSLICLKYFIWISNPPSQK